MITRSIKLVEPTLPFSKSEDTPKTSAYNIGLPVKPLLLPFRSAERKITPSEIQQRGLGECPLIAVIAAMTNTQRGQEQLRRMIDFDEQMVVFSSIGEQILNTQGLVVVKFPTISRSSHIKISRLLYRYEDTGDLVYASSTQQQGWVGFIEKAYAILVSTRNKWKNTSYQALRFEPGSKTNINVKQVFQDMLGVPVLVIDIKRNPRIIMKFLSEVVNFPTVATTPLNDKKFNTPHGETYGLAANHAYAIKGIKEKIINRRKDYIVELIGDEPDEVPFRLFMEDFDQLVTLKRP